MNVPQHTPGIPARSLRLPPRDKPEHAARDVFFRTDFPGAFLGPFLLSPQDYRCGSFYFLNAQTAGNSPDGTAGSAAAEKRGDAAGPAPPSARPLGARPPRPRPRLARRLLPAPRRRPPPPFRAGAGRSASPPGAPPLTAPARAALGRGWGAGGAARQRAEPGAARTARPGRAPTAAGVPRRGGGAEAPAPPDRFGPRPSPAGTLCEGRGRPGRLPAGPRPRSARAPEGSAVPARPRHSARLRGRVPEALSGPARCGASPVQTRPVPCRPPAPHAPRAESPVRSPQPRAERRGSPGPPRSAPLRPFQLWLTPFNARRLPLSPPRPMSRRSPQGPGPEAPPPPSVRPCSYSALRPSAMRLSS